MKFLLTAKHWQVFLLIIIALALAEINIEDNPILTLTFNIIGTLIHFIWPILVGHELQNYLPKKVELNYTFFLINGALIILVVFGGIIITGGGTWQLQGLAALPVFYLMFAVFYVFSFPGRTIRSIENGKEAGLSESIGDFFLAFFLPVGIWFLQPKINKIVEASDTGVE